LLIDREMSAELFGSLETIAVYKSGYADLFHHERVLLLVAKLMGQDTLGALAVEDGYPFYKFVDTGDREHSTVVYDVRNEVYYIDVPAQIRRAHGNLIYEPSAVAFSSDEQKNLIHPGQAAMKD
jgi:hypothetical protein